MRALDTARAIATDVTVDGRFVELDYGDWDGTPGNKPSDPSLSDDGRDHGDRHRLLRLGR